jgi:hypothetical protein
MEGEDSLSLGLVLYDYLLISFFFSFIYFQGLTAAAATP